MASLFPLPTLLLLMAAVIRAEVYSSSSDMRTVLATERKVVRILDAYAQRLQAKMDRINAYINGFNEAIPKRNRMLNEEAKKNETNVAEMGEERKEEELFDAVAGHPVHAFKLVKRMHVDLKRIEQDLKDNDHEEVSFALRKEQLNSPQPKEVDLTGSTLALLRLQDVYLLNTSNLALGKVGSDDQENALSVKDCLFLGKHAFKNNMFALAVEWFEQAWLKLNNENNDNKKSEVSLVSVERLLDEAAKEHDVRVLRHEQNRQLLPQPVHVTPPREQRNNMNGSEIDLNSNEERFNALCRGQELRDPKYASKLRCHLRNSNDLYYLLHPLKVEEAHLDPDLIVYHDVMSPEELKALRSVAGPFLLRSQVHGTRVAGNNEVSKGRTSKAGWMQDLHHPVVQRMTNRIHYITGLNTNTWTDDAELLQVANYINGGHYDPHHDYIMKDKDPHHMIHLPHTGLYIGDRVATWMFYVNEVKAGGRTAFPILGASVPPSEGSAVFWYNVFDDGQPDRRTLHGACPVLLGTKWVGNKWIREGAQIRTRPCSLQPSKPT